MKLAGRLLLGIAGSVLLTAGAGTAAYAADIPVFIPSPAPVIIPPPVPVAVFTGPYLGLILGYGSGNKFWDNDPYGPWGTTEHHVRGGLLGLEAGYRFQPGNLVFGIEGDWAWTNMNAASDCGPNDDYECATDLDWLATITGQVGFAPLGSNLLVYGEAGFAWARENFTVSGPGLGTPLTGSINNSGWLVGGGVAMAVNDRVYIKAEYNYIHFGTETVGVDNGGPTTEFDMTQSLHVFKLGVGILF